MAGVRDEELERRFAAYVERHVLTGTAPSIERLVADRPDLATPLRALVDRYRTLAQTLDSGLSIADTAPSGGTLPTFDGFRTIERIGAGGMGQVYKLHDLKLDRVVAAKVMRPDQRIARPVADFLREARSMALFQDRRIVQIFEFRSEATPPVIIMELVEGFELGRIGPSLELSQQARVLVEVCDAIQHAHALGIQHRDLKPSNIMLDVALSPKILDFGLSAGAPTEGHFIGTPHYLAPEQLDPAAPIDARTDVYALGVILYELLSNTVPYGGATPSDILAALRRGQPRLPVEINPRAPEPLQAIALKAMEPRPSDRYQSAREMSLDLRRYLDGRPVLARPTMYATTLESRMRPHVDQIEEWLRLKLIYPHEAERLRAAYRRLEAREDDWIVGSRTLSYSQIALYLGAFLLVAGSLFYFGAHRFHDAVRGVVRPFFALAVPFIGLNAAGRYLYSRERKAVAVAFFLAGVSLLPLFLLIWFHETGLWIAPAGTPGQLFAGGSVSNTQLQVTIACACGWSGWLALRTKTTALSTVLAVLLFLLAIAVLSDFGLRSWIVGRRFDRFALHVAPLAVVYAWLGVAAERREKPWFVGPLYLGAVMVFVAALDLLALDGRALHYVGVSFQPLQGRDVSNPTLVDTVAALTMNGVVFYAAASAIDWFGSAAMKAAAWLLFTIVPFSALEPLAYLSETAEYSRRFDWTYLALALAIVVASHWRERKSFYYAGLLNTGIALYLIASHQHYFDKPLWAISLIGVGLIALGAGFALDAARASR